MTKSIHPENLGALMEALSEVRSPYDGDEMLEEGLPTAMGAKLADKMGTGSEGSAKATQDRIVTKYAATKETVANINNGMSPKNAIKAAMDKYAAGMGNHNPQVKDILGDLALNYPNMFSKHFKQKVSMKAESVDPDEFEDEFEDEDQINEELTPDQLKAEAVEVLQRFLEHRTGMPVTLEEASEFMLDAIAEGFGG